MIPTQMYKCMMVVPKEEATIPAPTIRPPVITTGLLPYRFTSMLLTGPAGKQVTDRFITVGHYQYVSLTHKETYSCNILWRLATCYYLNLTDVIEIQYS